jgi:hypothetical protein
VTAFIAAQIVGAAFATAVGGWLWAPASRPQS